VFKKLLLETTEDGALFCIAHMKQGKIVNLNDELSLLASKPSIEFKLPMADSRLVRQPGWLSHKSCSFSG
jgi:hypothetical protein